MIESGRLLRHARHSVSPLGQNAAHTFAANHALCHYPSRAIYSFIPKNGCTTLRIALAMGNGVVIGREDWHWIHKNNRTFVASLAELVTAPHSFVILRCPFRRLASAFLDKIVNRSPEFWALHRQLHDTLDSTTFTFSDFVDLICKPELRKLDIHWRPQSDFLVYEDYDRWIALENLSESLPELEAMFGHAILDARPLSGHGTAHLKPLPRGYYGDHSLSKLSCMREEGQIPAHVDLYNARLRGLVRNSYKDDLRLYVAKFGEKGLAFAPDKDRAGDSQ